jgi:hypothetical protein
MPAVYAGVARDATVQPPFTLQNRRGNDRLGDHSAHVIGAVARFSQRETAGIQPTA